MIFRKKGDHFVRKRVAVGLQHVVDLDAAPAVSIFKLDQPAIEVQPDQRRLAALKDEIRLSFGVGQRAPHDDFQRFKAHRRPHGAGAVFHLVGVKAIAAAHIARARNRLDHDGDRRHGFILPRFFMAFSIPQANGKINAPKAKTPSPQGARKGRFFSRFYQKSVRSMMFF